MKLTDILIISIAATTISSCSLLSPKSKTTDMTPIKVSTAKSDGSNKNAASSDEDLADRITGEWVIVSAGGKSIGQIDDMPYITFEKSSGRFYASNGCNVLNGSYTLSPSGKLTFGEVLSTMKMCQDLPYESSITAALSGESPLNASIKKLGHDSYLTLTDAKGVELLSAKKHNMDFLNGNWQITSVGGKTVEGDEASIFIDINELKVHGNTGCNFFNGVLYINPDKSNAIDFSNLGSTRMMCPNMEQESAILLALEETVSAIQGSEGNVMLLNSAGKELMTLRSIPVEKE